MIRPLACLLVLTLALVAGCATRPDSLGSYVPTDPWFEGPPEPMQVIDQKLSRLLLAVPPDLDGGQRYATAPAMGVYVQRLAGGAILYARYVDPAYLAAKTDPVRLLESLYKDEIVGRTGQSGAHVTTSRMELPFGPVWMMEADGPKSTCAAFVSPLRVGREAPAGASDAILRGSLCGTRDPKADLVRILRSLVLRE